MNPAINKKLDEAFKFNSWQYASMEHIGINTIVEFMKAEYPAIHNAIHKRWPDDLNQATELEAPKEAPKEEPKPEIEATKPKELPPLWTKEEVDDQIARLKEIRKEAK